MGFKKIVGSAMLCFGIATAENLEKKNQIGMRLARPHIETEIATTGTIRACKLNGEVINNTCITINANINAAVSDGHTCYSAEINGETRVTCETSTEKCYEVEVQSKEIRLKVQDSQVSEHYCAKLNS